MGYQTDLAYGTKLHRIIGSYLQFKNGSLIPSVSICILLIEDAVTINSRCSWRVFKEKPIHQKSVSADPSLTKRGIADTIG